MLWVLNLEEICFERMAVRFFFTSRRSGDSASTGAGTGGGSASPSVTTAGFFDLLDRFGLAGWTGGEADTGVSLLVSCLGGSLEADRCGLGPLYGPAWRSFPAVAATEQILLDRPVPLLWRTEAASEQIQVDRH